MQEILESAMKPYATSSLCVSLVHNCSQATYSASAAAVAGNTDHAIAINNIDVSAEYIHKLRQELEGVAERLFTAASEQDRLRRYAPCCTQT